jgi:hypothetical protein
MPFGALGLAPGADEREVRRAYARLLKFNRPDDDPVAFQALHEAYEACLRQIREDRWHAGEDVLAREADEAPVAEVRAALPQPGDRVEALPEPGPHRPEAPPSPTPGHDAGFEPRRFDFSRFMQALFEQIAVRDAAGLSAWLQAEPDLYSIQLKSAITVDVLRNVVALDPPVSADRLQAIGEFFGVHQLGPRDWWLVERMEQAQHHAALRERFRRGQLPRSGQAPPRAIDRMMDTELASPRWSWRMLPLTFVPMLPTRTRDRILELDQLTDGLSETLIEPRRRAWFEEVADRSRISGKRLGLSVLRSLVFGGLFLLFNFWLTGDVGTELPTFVAAVGAFMLGWQLMTAAYLKFKRALEKRGLAQYLREGIVGTCVLVALVSGALGSAGLPIWLAIAAVGYAATRARLMLGGLVGLMLGVADAVLTAPDGVEWPFPPSVVGLGVAALLILALDRVRVRRTGLPLHVVAADDKWLKTMAGVCFAAVALGFVVLLTVSLR